MGRPALDDKTLSAMRGRLAEATLAIYRERGLDAISFRRVAERVGVSHTLIYRYFPDKDALMAHARRDCFLRFDAFVRAREITDAGMFAHFHSIAHAYVAFAEEHTGDYVLMFSTEQPPPDRYPELLTARQDMFEHAVAAIAFYVEAGELIGDPRLIAHAFWINLHGLMMLYTARQLVHGCALDELVDPIIDRLIAGGTSAAG